MKYSLLIIYCLTVFSLSGQVNGIKIIKQGIFNGSILVDCDNRNLKSESTRQKLDSAINYFDTSGELIAYLKEYFEYDEKGNLIRKTDYVRNNSENRLEDGFQWEFEYNNLNKWTTVLITQWNKNDSLWSNLYKEVFEYDTKGNNIKTVYKKPDSTLLHWINDYKQEYIFNANNDITVHYYFLWDSLSSAWKYDYKIEHIYDSQGKLKESNFSNADTIPGDWINDYNSVFTYNNNLLKYILHKKWIVSTSTWQKDYLAKFSYDSVGNRIQNIYNKWDTEGKWIGEYKENFIYNDSSLLSQYYLYQWDTVFYKWNNLEKKDFTYPYSKETKLVLPRFFYEENGKMDINALASSLSFDWDTIKTDWINIEKRNLYFSDYNGIIISAGDISEIPVKIYPNPVSEILYIEIPSKIVQPAIEVYNSLGNLVYKSDKNEPIPVSKYPKGYYFIKISKHGKILATRKIIIS